MRDFKIIFLLVICFISCKTNSKKDRVNIVDTFPNEQKQKFKAVDETRDSLRDPSSFYFLTDYPIRKCGDLILKDSIYPRDNEITFSCMDSISSSDKQTRDYFFPIFLKIIAKSDGALSEAVGSYVMKYLEKYPKEFVQRSKQITDSSFKSMAYFAAYEIGFQFEKNPSKWTNSILAKCMACDSLEIDRIKTFNKIVLKTVEENK